MSCFFHYRLLRDWYRQAWKCFYCACKEERYKYWISLVRIFAFHAFSWCNTSVSFYGKEKCIWLFFSRSTEHKYTYIELDNSPLTLSEVNIRLLELFILYVYFCKNCRYTDTKKARFISFVKSPNLKLKGTFLLKDDFLEDIKRSAYQ